MVVGFPPLALHLRRLAWGAISLGVQFARICCCSASGTCFRGSAGPGVLAAAELRRDGLSARRVRFVLGFTVWFYNIRTLLGIGALAFLVAFARQHPGVREAGLWWVGAIVVLLVLAATARLAAGPTTARRTARALALLRRWQPAPAAEATSRTARRPARGGRRPCRQPAHRVVLVVLAAGSWIADAVRLRRSLAAAGVTVDADILLLAYAVGILISSLPLPPGGFGAVEAAIPATPHHLGAPLDASVLAGTLVYRAISRTATRSRRGPPAQRNGAAQASVPPHPQRGKAEPIALNERTRTESSDASGGNRAFDPRPGQAEAGNRWRPRSSPAPTPSARVVASRGSGLPGVLDGVRGASTTSQGPRRRRSSTRLSRTRRRRRSARCHGTTTISASHCRAAWASTWRSGPHAAS